MDRNLRNYNKYLDSLLLYAKAHNISVAFKEVPGDGQYVPAKREIQIDNDMSQSSVISTILHELGHALDDSISWKKPNSYLGKAYDAVYSITGSPTAKQLEAVIACEKRAWDMGEVIAKQCKIKLGKWYFKGKLSALNNYRKT